MENLGDIFSTYGVIGQAFINFWWIVLPGTLYFVFNILWGDFVFERSQFCWLNGLEWTMIEIIPPKEIERSPKPMESIFMGLTGVLTTYSTFDAILKGAKTDRFSLELVGEEGNIHFYIRTQKKWRNSVEAQIYAHYPEAEIREVEDYVTHFPKVIPNKNWDLWGSDFEFVSPDPFPIKTYDKFEEDITGTLIDPMASIVEVLGTLPPGQHIWLQFVIEPQPEKDKSKYMKEVQKFAGRVENGKKGVLEHIGEVFTSIPKAVLGPVEFAPAAKKEQQPLEFRMTPIEKEILKALEDNLSRNLFKTKVRMIYLGRKEGFNRSFIGTFVGAIKQFNDLHMNQFKPNDLSKTYGNYLFKKERLAFRQRKIYRRYKSRSMDGAKVLLSTRELATVYHFPDMNVRTPALVRVESKKGTAPANLPIG